MQQMQEEKLECGRAVGAALRLPAAPQAAVQCPAAAALALGCLSCAAAVRVGLAPSSRPPHAQQSVCGCGRAACRF